MPARTGNTGEGVPSDRRYWRFLKPPPVSNNKLFSRKVCTAVFACFINGSTFSSQEGEPEDESLVKTKLLKILKNIL